MTPTQLPADQAETSNAPSAATAWAWGICWLMFASTILNYMDRQTMTLVGPMVKEEFHLDNVDYGWVLAAFGITYALFQVPAGYLVDKLDTRRTYAGAVAFWSLAGMAAAFSPSLAMLLVFRALLGVGESFNWPCALRATAQILPPADRSLGNGIFNSGAAIGAVLTPLIVTPLTVAFGWRTAFIAVGLAGFVWVCLWLTLLGGERRKLLAREKKTSLQGELPLPQTRPSDLARYGFATVAGTSLLVAATAVWFGPKAVSWGVAWLMFGMLLAARLIPEEALAGADWAESLGAVVRFRRFWILVVVSVSINVCWHFLVNWLPTYLKEDRGMTFLASGLWTAVPFLAADAGNLGGGALSRFFAGRGHAPSRARLAVMTLCTLMITCGAWVGLIQSDTMVIVLLGVMAMATAAFMANYFAFTQEVSTRHTGLIVGILGGVGNLCAASFHPIAGWVRDETGGFGPVFVLVGLLPFLGLGAMAVGWGGDTRSDPKPG